MDPQACWNLYLDACKESDMVARYLLLCDLLEWYHRRSRATIANVTLKMLELLRKESFAYLSPDEREDIR